MLEEYFDKIDFNTNEFLSYQLGGNIDFHNSSFPSLEDKTVALFGVTSNDNNTLLLETRNSLYSLSTQDGINNTIIDLGNIKLGATTQDTNEAIITVTDTLLKHGIVSMLLSDDLNHSENLYEAIAKNQNNIELSIVTASLPILEHEVLDRICTSQPNRLLSINAIAFQEHYSPPKSFDLFENLNFGHLRLGMLKDNINAAEPYLRESSVAIFDTDAIRYNDCPSLPVRPTGLTSEDACQIIKYIGAGENTQAISIHTKYSSESEQKISAATNGLLVWYFISGFLSRTNDGPDKHNEFTKYRCELTDGQPPILFLKSNRTSRWWMQLSDPSDNQTNKAVVTIPCSYEDYIETVAGTLPKKYYEALKRI